MEPGSWTPTPAQQPSQRLKYLVEPRGNLSVSERKILQKLQFLPYLEELQLEEERIKGEIKLTRGDNLCGGSRGRTRSLRKLNSLKGRNRRVAVSARRRPDRLDRAVIL